MIELRPDEHAALARLERAGADGLTLQDMPVSHAIRLELSGFAKLHPFGGGQQRITITKQGRAHLLRVVL